MNIYQLYTNYVVTKKQMPSVAVLTFIMVDEQDTVTLYYNGTIVGTGTGSTYTFNNVELGKTYTYNATIMGNDQITGQVTITNPQTTVDLSGSVDYYTVTFNSFGHNNNIESNFVTVRLNDSSGTILVNNVSLDVHGSYTLRVNKNDIIYYDYEVMNYKHITDTILVNSNKTITPNIDTVTITFVTETANIDLRVYYNDAGIPIGETYGTENSYYFAKNDTITYSIYFWDSEGTVRGTVICDSNKTVNVASPRTLTVDVPYTMSLDQWGDSGTHIQVNMNDSSGESIIDQTIRDSYEVPVTVPIEQNSLIYYNIMLYGYKYYSDTIRIGEQNETINIHPTAYPITFTSTGNYIEMQIQVDGNYGYAELWGGDSYTINIIENDILYWSAYDYDSEESYSNTIIVTQAETINLGSETTNLIFEMLESTDSVSLYNNGDLIETKTGQNCTFDVQDGETYTYEATLMGYKHLQGTVTITQTSTIINLANQISYNTLTINTNNDNSANGNISINNVKTINLPNGYKLTKYIANSYDQYINTNYNLKANDKVTIEFTLGEMRNGYDAVFGSCGDWGEYGQNNYVVYTNYDWMGTFAYGRSGDTTSGESNDREILYTVITQNNICNITNNSNGAISTITTSGQLEDSTYPCYIFTSNNAGTPDMCCIMKLYYFKIEDSSGNLIHEYYPCLNANDKPGLYDTVTGNFLINENEWSTDFSYGDITGNKVYKELYAKDLSFSNGTTVVYADSDTVIKYNIMLYNYKQYVNEILLDSDKVLNIKPQTANIVLNTQDSSNLTLYYEGNAFAWGWNNLTQKVILNDTISYTARFYDSVTIGDNIYCNEDKVINIATPATKTLTFNVPVTTDPYGGSSGTNIKAWIDGTTDLVLDVTLEQTEPVSVKVLENGSIYYEVIVCGYKKYSDTVTLDQDKTININPTMYQLTFTANPGLDLTLEINGELFMPSLNNDVIFQVVEYDTVNYSAYDFSTGESYSGSVYVTQNETINVGPQPVNLTIVTNNANSIVTITNRNQSTIQTGSTTVFSVYINSNIQYVIQTQGYVTIIDNTTIAQATTLTFTLDVETNGIWDMQYPFNDSLIQSYTNQIITNGNNDWEINNNLYAITNANPQDDGNYYTNFSFVTPANATNYLIQTIGYISSEENCDFGAIYCGTQIYQPSKYDIEQGNTDGNGQYLLRGSGLLPIQSSQMLLLPGETYYLSLAYNRDSGNSSGEDKLIIKEIKLVEDVPDNINDCDYVDYIQATGSQYIDTGIYPDDTTVVKAKFIYENQSGGAFIGYNIGDEENSFRFFVIGSTYLDYGSGAGWNRIDTWFIDSTTSIYEVEFGNRYIKDLVNDTTIISDTQVSFAEKTYTIKIFDNSDYGKMYYLQIYKQGNLVRNLLPVYNRVKRQYKMYDTVSQAFFNNDGTGSFNGGND